MPAAPASPATPAPGSAEKLNQLRVILHEMFQLDRGDLDFGLYRIMNMKSAEIKSFLDEDLLPQVQEKLQGISAEERERIEKKLAKACRQARELGGIDPEETDMVKNLREELKEAQADAEAEADIYNHLANFFSRYYSEGDFMSLRRYTSGGKSEYLIPYNGEEVKLHWANADQYYIKTTENYASYIFAVGSEQRVRFEIAAAENNKDNTKENNGSQRRFLLTKASPVTVDGNDLVVRFEHRSLSDSEKRRYPGNGAKQQNRINAAAEKRILDLKSLSAEWRLLLVAAAPTQANGERTVLAQHLDRYTAKNSFDYFIHKDLGGFLQRELDLYLKNEVLNLDDLDRGDASHLRRALARLRATRFMAEKIIAFLAQLENFQKRLWVKKKFVLETQYCVTLDKVSEKFYPAIIANTEQIEEWRELFSIEEVKGDLSNGQLGHNKPISVEFLKSNPYLVLDTRHFDANFTNQLLAELSSNVPLDDQLNGLLIHGENFHALNFLQARYAEKVQCVYLDPPFNTDNKDFLYKDSYRSSSWLSSMSDRIALSRQLMADDGQFAIHIDENENKNLHRLMLNIFGSSNFLGEMVWNKRNPKGDASGLAIQHEYILWACKNTNGLSSDDSQIRRPKKNAEKILEKAAHLTKVSSSLEQAREKFKTWMNTQPFSKGELAYKHLDEQGNVYRSVSMAWPNRKQAPKEYFIPLVHPETGKECPVPARGWRSPPETMQERLERGQVLFGPDETTQPQRKYLLSENMNENIASVFDHGGSSDHESKAIGISFDMYGSPRFCKRPIVRMAKE